MLCGSTGVMQCHLLKLKQEIGLWYVCKVCGLNNHSYYYYYSLLLFIIGDYYYLLFFSVIGWYYYYLSISVTTQELVGSGNFIHKNFRHACSRAQPLAWPVTGSSFA